MSKLKNQSVKDQVVQARKVIQSDSMKEVTAIMEKAYSNEEKLRLIEARINFNNSELEKLNQTVAKQFEEEPAVEQLTLF
ncbi:hypothetical protein HXA34_20515 [Salipaludibacillus agaradhaerens]|uniref:hypothetical protein n=1 Tax=Salipaludibacillus agaradhaerens TaxID=76935 RepID=UPI00215074E4|nr:hypothetical protein [Salipaludibacillus agaradhaerens]MCR6108683.1 hypothetical protein [Salipaludibacillus agaradhaerens]MCR6120706.1 hypothetical protein [Salipaludibacillus agaradhaerens]